MTSTFGGAFDRLDTDLQRRIISSLRTRKQRYLHAMDGKPTEPRFVLLGDTPGPGRPTDPTYHHTPFYSTRNSSLWINRLLQERAVDEGALTWFNTTLANGSPLDPAVFTAQLTRSPLVICLGGNAERWLKCNARWSAPYLKVHHPQAWKRFRSREPYPLLDLLTDACST